MKGNGIFLLAIVIFACVPNTFMNVFGVFYASMMTITVFSYDERTKWDKYQRMLPYSPTSIVLNKFIFAYICMGAAGLLMAGVRMVTGLVTGSLDVIKIISDIFPIICAAAIAMCLYMVIIFKMGVEKSRLFYMIIMIGTALLYSTNASIVNTAVSSFDRQGTGIKLLVLAAVTVLVNLISILISNKIYVSRRA